MQQLCQKTCKKYCVLWCSLCCGDPRTPTAEHWRLSKKFSDPSWPMPPDETTPRVECDTASSSTTSPRPLPLPHDRRKVSFTVGKEANVPVPLSQVGGLTGLTSTDHQQQRRTSGASDCWSEPDTTTSGLFGTTSTRSASPEPKHYRLKQTCQMLSGLRSGKAWWGLEDADFGVLPQSWRKEWCAEGSHPDHSETTWWTTTFYQIPRVRHLGPRPLARRVERAGAALACTVANARAVGNAAARALCACARVRVCACACACVPCGCLL